MFGLDINSVAVLAALIFGSGGLLTALGTLQRYRKQTRLLELQIKRLEAELAATRGRIVKPNSNDVRTLAPPPGIEKMAREAARQQETAAAGGRRKPLTDLSALLLSVILWASLALLAMVGLHLAVAAWQEHRQVITVVAVILGILVLCCLVALALLVRKERL